MRAGVAARIHRGQDLGAGQEEHVVGVADRPAGHERVTDAQDRAAHHRPRDGQLLDLLLADRDEPLGLGEQLSE